jgi:CAAX prenyl protease-like protein
MRWLVKDDFASVQLGTYTPRSFWITAVFFAAEHGPYWEVGLIAGVIYNWLMIRTRSIGDCILAHAITNAILSAFVITTGRWEYWM